MGVTVTDKTARDLGKSRILDNTSRTCPAQVCTKSNPKIKLNHLYLHLHGHNNLPEIVATHE